MTSGSGTTTAADGLAQPRPARRPMVGTVLTLAGAATAELLAEPFDLIWVDLEHGALGRTEAQEMILGAQAVGVFAFVRIGTADADSLVGPMLDAGADGIVIADVRAASQADSLAGLTRYPPAGRRGFGPRRAALRHRTTQVWASEPARLWVQIESQEGVANAKEIACTPGVDALIVGIADLCVDLGIPVGLTDPRLHDALRAVSSAADQAGTRFGLAGPLHHAEQLGELIDASSVLVHSTDARLCAAAVDAAVETLRTVALSSSSGTRKGITARG